MAHFEGSESQVKGWTAGCTLNFRYKSVNPPWRQPRGKWMVSLANPHTNTTSKRWHLWEIDLRFALNSTPGWFGEESGPKGAVWRTSRGPRGTVGLADYSKVDTTSFRYKCVNFGARGASSVGLADYSQVDTPGFRYKCVNFGVGSGP